MKWLLKNSSNQEPGTLQQLKNLLNRHLPNDPKGDMNGYEDFLFIIGIGHMMSAAMELLGMTCAEDVPKHFIPSDTSSMNMDDKKTTITSFITTFVDRFVNLHLLEEKSSTQPQSVISHQIDGVFEYAREVLTLSLLYGEFQDAIREGDGLRILRCWKFFLLLFKASRRMNYANEPSLLFCSTTFYYPSALPNSCCGQE